MTSKHILIVDDDPDLLFLAAHGLKNLGPNYHVTTAADVSSALDQAKKQRFDLIVTDYMLPERTGLELIEEVRQFSPETQFILMTAHHNTGHVLSQVESLQLADFVGKPFTLNNFLKSVQSAVAELNAASKAEVSRDTSDLTEAVREQLRTLRHQAGARSVLLVSSNGYPVQVAGNISPARAARLAAFVCGNFLAISEMANLFGDNDSIFTSSYHEGNSYNIYSHNINGDFFLTVIFNAGGKPGTVWFYTKQVATALASLLPSPEATLTTRAGESLSKDFDDLLGSDTVDDN
jgi:CheY-like chemotaxis protein/predicted regulator of Ras-like GTPase activity (Roadblock/LC7/MglB family)